MVHPSTFSIAAYSSQENAWGIAVASKFPAVGSVVPWVRAGAGAVATQSFANTSFGPRGLELMEKGASAQQVLNILLADDPQREHRQVGMVDASGEVATFTGKECHEWAGGKIGSGYTVQGNILASEEVITSMADAFENRPGTLVWRLYSALMAGDRSGGDRRGRQSAAIYIAKQGGGYGGFNDRWIDYRVDDHPDPVLRLGELLELHDLYFGKSSESDRLQLTGKLLITLQAMMLRLGYYRGQEHGLYDHATRQALEEFIGNENFEERVDFETGTIDKPVYDFLLQNFGE